MRKPILKFVVMLATCMLISGVLALGVNAEEFSAHIGIKDKVIIYSGVSGSLPLKAVNVLVISGLGEPTDSNIVGIQSSFTDEDGSFSGMIYLDSEIVAGKYKAFIDSEYGSASKKFIVIDENESVSYLNVLNGKANTTDFENYLKQNSEYFGIFYDDYSVGFSYASKIVFARKPISGYSYATDVFNRFQAAYAIYKVVSSTDTAKELEINADVLSIDYGVYSGLSDASKEALNALLKNEDYTQSEFKDLFERNLVYADITTSTVWNELKDRMLKYASKTQINLVNKYNQLNNKDAVFQEMFRRKAELVGFDNLFEKFNSIVDTRYTAEHAVNQNYSSGGGGGFGGTTGSGIVDTYSGSGSFSSVGGFADIGGHWASEYIRKLANNGGISGYQDGSFKPDSYITRAEFTTIIVNVFGINGTSEIAYDDVSPEDWYNDYIIKAAANSIIFGSDGRFRPKENITRQDAAVIIYRLLKQRNIQMKNGAEYYDATDISGYASAAVSELSGIGIINGNEGRFLPKNSITRAEAATIIALAMDKI